MNTVSTNQPLFVIKEPKNFKPNMDRFLVLANPPPLFWNYFQFIAQFKNRRIPICVPLNLKWKYRWIIWISSKFVYMDIKWREGESWKMTIKRKDTPSHFLSISAGGWATENISDFSDSNNTPIVDKNGLSLSLGYKNCQT